MYVSRADYLSLDNHCFVVPWEKPPLLLPDFLSWLYSFVYNWGLLRFFLSTLAWPPMQSLLTFGESCWRYFMVVTSDIIKKNKFMANSLILRILKSFHPVFLSVLRMSYRCTLWNELYNSAFCLVVVFLCWSPSVALRIVLDERWRLHVSISLRTNVCRLLGIILVW